MKRIKPQYFLILLLVAALAAAPFLIRGLIDRSSVGKQPAASVTAAPEETAEPTPTPEPTPLQFTTVDTSYFDDALFIGDSRTVGIAEYGSLKNATYFADVGLNVYVAQTKAIAVKNVGTVTLPQLLSQKTFGKVYIMLGINELGNDLDDITAKFSSLIDTVRAAQPDAIIFVEANLHVGPSRSSTDATFNNPRIDKLNEKLAALADGKTIIYIDINELFDDENGNHPCLRQVRPGLVRLAVHEGDRALNPTNRRRPAGNCFRLAFAVMDHIFRFFSLDAVARISA